MSPPCSGLKSKPSTLPAGFLFDLLFTPEDDFQRTAWRYIPEERTTLNTASLTFVHIKSTGSTNITEQELKFMLHILEVSG
jgi:hypothetical protein